MNHEEDFQSYSRNKYGFFILPRFQIKIISLAILSSLGTIIVAGGVFDYLVERQFDRVLSLVTLTPEVKTELLSSMSMSVLYLLILCSAFAILMLGFAIAYSHKIAGPIFHISKSIDNFLEGATQSRVNLRRGDEFFFLGDKVNRILDRASTGHTEKKRII